MFLYHLRFQDFTVNTRVILVFEINSFLIFEVSKLVDLNLSLISLNVLFTIDYKNASILF